MTLDRKGKFTVLNFVSFLLALKVNLNIFIDNRDTCIFAVGLNQFIVRPTARHPPEACALRAKKG